MRLKLDRSVIKDAFRRAMAKHTVTGHQCQINDVDHSPRTIATVAARPNSAACQASTDRPYPSEGVYEHLIDLKEGEFTVVLTDRKLLKRQGCVPRRLITDKLRSYSAAHRTVMLSVVHRTHQYANNRAEVSHQPTRQRERQMRRFKSTAHLQRFASVHGVVQNLFRVGRHLLRATHHRVLRSRAFVEWEAVTCAC